MPDALEQAKDLFLDASTRRGLNHLPVGDVAELAQAAALIAIAEEVRTLNATLHDMTDLNGAAKVTLAHDTVIKIAQ